MPRFWKVLRISTSDLCEYTTVYFVRMTLKDTELLNRVEWLWMCIAGRESVGRCRFRAKASGNGGAGKADEVGMAN